MYDTTPIIKDPTNRMFVDLEQWYFDYREELYQWLTYTTGYRDVEFLLIEVFRQFAKRFYPYKEDVSPRLWLLSIVRTQLRKWRRQKLQQFTPIQSLQFQEPEESLYSTLKTLPVDEQDVLILRGIMGLSSEEAAIVLNTNAFKVNRLLQRALHHFYTTSPNRATLPFDDEDALLQLFEQMPRQILFDDQSEYIFQALQKDWQRIAERVKRRKRIRWISVLVSSAAILLMILFFSVTEMGRGIAMNVWVKLNHNIITLEEGVIAKYDNYIITEADFENVERMSHLQDRLATLMVYVEAIAKGYQPNLQQVEEELASLRDSYQSDEVAQANMFEVMQQANISAEEYWEHKQKWITIENVVTQYYIDLFGTPSFPEKPLPNEGTYYYDQYVTAVQAFKYKKLVEEYEQVIFNKAYDFEFHWLDWMKQWRWDYEVIVMHNDTPILTVNTPRFDPDNMTDIELQTLIGYELLYQEAMNRGYRSDGQIQNDVIVLQQKYAMDPQYRDEVQRELKRRKITEEQYWNELNEIVIREKLLKQYMGFLYPETYKMTEKQLQRAIEIVSLEKFHLMKEQLIFNERYLRQFQWELEQLKRVPEQMKDYLVVASYKDTEFIERFATRFRFSRNMYDFYLFTMILADNAREFGYTVNEPLANDFMQNYYEVLTYDDYARVGISDALRLTGITLDEVLALYRKYFEGVTILEKMIDQTEDNIADSRWYLNQDWMQILYMDYLIQFKEEHGEYWKYIQYNPNYPLVD